MTDYVKKMLVKALFNKKFAMKVYELFNANLIFIDNNEVDLIEEQVKCDWIHNLIMSNAHLVALFYYHKNLKNLYFWDATYQEYAYKIIKNKIK